MAEKRKTTGGYSATKRKPSLKARAKSAKKAQVRQKAATKVRNKK